MEGFLRWKKLGGFGRVQRRDKYEATSKIFLMSVDGKRNRVRPKLRCRDLVKADMARNHITTDMAEGGQKAGRRQAETLACHNSNRHTTLTLSHCHTGSYDCLIVRSVAMANVRPIGNVCYDRQQRSHTAIGHSSWW